MMEETKLCLTGEMAKPFLKYKIGDKLKVNVEMVLTSAGMENDYSVDLTGSGKDKTPAKRPRCGSPRSPRSKKARTIARNKEDPWD
jgi:hypothetical protein